MQPLRAHHSVVDAAVEGAPLVGHCPAFLQLAAAELRIAVRTDALVGPAGVLRLEPGDEIALGLVFLSGEGDHLLRFVEIVEGAADRGKFVAAGEHFLEAGLHIGNGPEDRASPDAGGILFHCIQNLSDISASCGENVVGAALLPVGADEQPVRAQMYSEVKQYSVAR